MRKSIVKVISVIMAFCLLMTIFPVWALASEDIIYITEEFSPIIYSPETELNFTPGVTMNRFYGSGGQVDATIFFYNQLTATQKELYNQIFAAGPVAELKIDVSKLNYGTQSDADVLSEMVSQDMMMTMSALIEDKPMCFWYGDYTSSMGLQVPSINNNNTTKLKSLKIKFDLKQEDFTDYNDVIEKQAELINKINGISVYGFSRHEKVKSINDYLAKSIVYTDVPNAHNPYGALVNGMCVCDGYAEAFKILCDREGIPCLNVVGNTPKGGHKWNMVQMEDNQWYLVDVTWNDDTEGETSYIYYSYLLSGSGTKAPYFSNNTVADSTVHVPTGKYYDKADTVLSYPTLSPDTYGVGLLKYGAPDVQFDATRGVIMVGKDVADYRNHIVNNSTSGFSRTRNGSGTTTSTMTVSDSRTTKTYLVAMRGDVNATNIVNANDYDKMVQICTTTATIEEGTAKFYAGDMNQDGAIDGFDAIAHQLYTNGTLIYN